MFQSDHDFQFFFYKTYLTTHLILIQIKGADIFSTLLNCGKNDCGLICRKKENMKQTSGKYIFEKVNNYFFKRKMMTVLWKHILNVCVFCFFISQFWHLRLRFKNAPEIEYFPLVLELWAWKPRFTSPCVVAVRQTEVNGKSFDF